MAHGSIFRPRLFFRLFFQESRKVGIIPVLEKLSTFLSPIVKYHIYVNQAYVKIELIKASFWRHTTQHVTYNTHRKIIYNSVRCRVYDPEVLKTFVRYTRN